MSELDTILEKLEGLEQGMAALQDAMGMLLEACAPPEAPPAPSPPVVASYEQMYGPVVASRVEEVIATPPPPSSRFKRWLTREEQ